ncbi:hypothetical protein ALO35_200061 [Pseudomonas amygdali pv. lachrymans]|uniref:Uncharacterized protein n=2 Tax=Pseudomonas amygdali TaxID=47877 RepID=A0A3M6GQV0_PSEAJ|nr:hypothetical protein ALO35_200061 [Pseudomonas amygdali pv. lachrymans]RMV94854.1 hypothetical protein ALP03_200213 [Pseudomonas amygdali pv. tabaci]
MSTSDPVKAKQQKRIHRVRKGDSLTFYPEIPVLDPTMMRAHYSVFKAINIKRLITRHRIDEPLP